MTLNIELAEPLQNAIQGEKGRYHLLCVCLDFCISFSIFKQLGAEAESPVWNYSTGKIPRYS